MEQRVERSAVVEWQTVHMSVPGDAHAKKAIVCQDCSGSARGPMGQWAHVAGADGHGSAAYFRSDRGARFAVDAMSEVFAEFQTLLRDARSGDESVDVGKWWEEYAKRLTVIWRAKVAADLAADPPEPPGDEGGEPGYRRALDDVRTRKGYGGLREHFRRMDSALDRALGPAGERSAEEPAPSDVDHVLRRAYGTTALGVLLGQDWLYWIQVGDGAMVKIVDGRASYLAPPPEGAIANQTPSLSDEDVVRNAIVGRTPLRAGEGRPSAIVLVTDGIPNSYVEPVGFFEFCRDIAGNAAQDRIKFQSDLTRWLPQISRQGSGDDMSVALAWQVGGPVQERTPVGGEQMPTPPVDQPPADHPPVDADGTVPIAAGDAGPAVPAAGSHPATPEPATPEPATPEPAPLGPVASGSAMLETTVLEPTVLEPTPLEPGTAVPAAAEHAEPEQGDGNAGPPDDPLDDPRATHGSVTRRWQFADDDQIELDVERSDRLRRQSGRRHEGTPDAEPR